MENDEVIAILVVTKFQKTILLDNFSTRVVHCTPFLSKKRGCIN